jgi:hypothetical protein
VAAHDARAADKLPWLRDASMLRFAPTGRESAAVAASGQPDAIISQGESMNTIVKSLIMGAVLAIASGRALAADPVIGTWNLNVAKSTFSPGPAPKNEVRTFAESPQGIVLTIKTTAADGKETVATLTFKQDGKPYPVSGNPDFDAVSVTHVDARTTHSAQMKAGATVGTGVRTVSKDGKSMTFARKGVRTGGVKFDDVLVYDRQ